ncbi:alpha-1 2-mannosidase [Bacteroidia bacterium]|nr:alpha-1 2-mannosidase [Bacteroidia bacterium]
MKKTCIFFTLIVFLISCNTVEKDKFPYGQQVNPFIGTDYNGHTFPNATFPFGMMQPGPQTGHYDWEYCSGYTYNDSVMEGFSQNRLNGTGCPDLGDILFSPFSGTPRNDFKSLFSKETEIAVPGYYAVELIDNAVKAEITCSPHVAFYRFSYRKDHPALFIDFQNGIGGTPEDQHKHVKFAEITIENNQTITGHLTLKGWVERQLFFVIEFDTPFTEKKEVLKDSQDQAPKYVFHYNLEKNNQLQVRTSFSTVSVEGAKLNLAIESKNGDFDQVKKNAQKAWETILSKIDIEGDDQQKMNFYTAMYHLMIQPNNIADVDGKYRGAKDEIHQSPFGSYYSTLSLWDTYRAAHPLYTLANPDKVSDMVNTMLLHAEAQGYLPVWALWGKENHCMIGNHAVPVIVEACLKNFPGIDKNRAFELIKKSLTENHLKSPWTVYDKYGYYPFDSVKEESVSRTLEAVYDDYCASLLAQELGLKEDYAFFKNRSEYYKNLFDPETKLMRAKDSNGKWRTPFSSFSLSHAGTAGGDYTEGNAWQYTWHVQHDVAGLIDLMGGKEYFTTKLDSLFVLESDVQNEGFVSDVTGLIGQYAQGNEPSHHIVYLYTLAGKPQRTQELVREIFDRFYLPKPGGLCGNDDCGQMSAWYIFSSLGFYPVNPVLGEYVLGAPQLPKATIHLPDNKTFTVIATNLSEKNKYVKSIRLNNQPITDYKLTYSQLMQGGTLIFEMTNK